MGLMPTGVSPAPALGPTRFRGKALGAPTNCSPFRRSEVKSKGAYLVTPARPIFTIPPPYNGSALTVAPVRMPKYSTISRVPGTASDTGR